MESNQMNDDERLAKAELVRDKTGASFTDARAALEANNYDVLDAIVWLERQGKVAEDGVHTASYTTAANPEDTTSAEMAQAQHSYEQATKPNGFVKALNRALEWTKGVLKKSVDVSFVVDYKDKRIMTMPLLLFIILLVVAFWAVVPIMIVCLFFDVRFHFEGVKPVTVDINQMADKMSEGAETLKRDVTGASKDNTEIQA